MDWISPNITRPAMLSLTASDRAFVLLSDIFALLSFSGSLVILYCYLRYSGIRTTSRLLLLCLSIANIMGSLSTIVQSMTYYRTMWFPNERSFVCQGASGMLVYTQVCTALWTLAISFYLFLCVTARCITVANRLVGLFHVFCWGMPFIVALSADLSGVYGYDSTDMVRDKHPTPCWLSDRVSNPLPWYFITVEGWVLAAYCIGTLLYFPILWSTIRNRSKGKEIQGDDVVEELAIQTANEQLRFIPVIYICTRIWGTGYFLFTRYRDDADMHLRAYDWLLIIKAIGNNSQGLVNAIFFCLATKQLRKIMSRALDRCCFCFYGWCREHRIIGSERWIRVPQIVRASRARPTMQRKRTLDGSDLDISGISLDLPDPSGNFSMAEEDEILFER